MKLITHHYQVLRLRISGAIPLLPLYAFMACSGGTLHVTLFIHRTGYLCVLVGHKSAKVTVQGKYVKKNQFVSSHKTQLMDKLSLFLSYNNMFRPTTT